MALSEPVPSKERQLKDTNCNPRSPFDVHPALFNLDEKREYFITRQLKSEKRHFSARGAAEGRPVDLTPTEFKNSPDFRDKEPVGHTSSEAGNG